MPTLRINKINENYTHFLTITVIEWIDIFTKKEYFDIIIESLKYCQKHKGLLLHEYVVMPNHLHLITSAKEDYELSGIVHDFKNYTTKEILKLLEQDNRRYILNLIKNSFSRKTGYENQIWQRENYPEMIDSEKQMGVKAKYIHENPVRKGLVMNPEDWLYSSAKNRFCNDNSIISLD